MNSEFPIESDRTVYIHRSFKREAEKSELKKNIIRRRHRSTWKRINFPERVDLFEYPEQTLQYFNIAYNYYDQGYNVDYDLSEVKKFSPESIAVLAALMQSEHFTKGGESRGNSPSNFIVNRIFHESGFFDHVHIKGRRPIHTNGQLLHKVTNKKVETEIAKSTCNYIKNKLNLKYNDDTEPFYTILIEAMQNTNNHASIKRKGDYDWWLYRYEDKGKKKIHFTFLDTGVGVFESYPVSAFKNVIRKLTGTEKKNIEIVNDLLAGKIRSRTKRKDRGKGIPQIYEMSQTNMIEDFYILTNDILINTKTKDIKELKQDFKGALYYWTIKT